MSASLLTKCEHSYARLVLDHDSQTVNYIMGLSDIFGAKTLRRLDVAKMSILNTHTFGCVHTNAGHRTLESFGALCKTQLSSEIFSQEFQFISKFKACTRSLQTNHFL